MTMKEWFAAQELAGMPGMPGTDRGVRMMFQSAKKNLHVSRTKVRGKGLEYALKSLPAETQAHLRAQAFAAVLAELPEAPKEAAPSAGKVIALSARTVSALAQNQQQPQSESRELRLATPDAVAFDGSTEADRAQAQAIAVVLRKVAEIEAAGARSVKAACLSIDYTVGGGANRAERQELIIYSWDRQAEPAGLF